MNDEHPDYKIDLDAYSGPLDLLLYLIRREEVDIYDIPVARITQQYLDYLDLMSGLNINVAGEFVVMAATLMEIKSRMMAPQPEVAPDEEDAEDPRLELVRQLMEYKRFKEAAQELNERAHLRAERFTRPGERLDGGTRPVTPLPADLTVWKLLDAFSRVLEQTGRRSPHQIVLDDVPQKELEERLEACVRAAGRISFFMVFEGESSRIILVGMFLALLQLVKAQVIRVEQEEAFGDIELRYVPEEERREPWEEPPVAGAETRHEEADDLELSDPPQVADAGPRPEAPAAG